MDSSRFTQGGLTPLTECISESMSAHEAAHAMRQCWVHAEQAMTPVIGSAGLGILFRRGEHVAARNLAMHSPPGTDGSIVTLCEWVETLPRPDAVVVSKAFLESVERHLVSLLGVDGARRLLGAAVP
jgi:hypothetical protein